MDNEGSTMRYDVIVTGHLCLDLIPDVSGLSANNLVSPGKLFEIGGIRISTGGAVSNTGLALHRLGAKVHLMALVGDDMLGQTIIQYIGQRDPDLTIGLSVKHDTPSSYTIVLSPERMDRTFLHCTGTNASFNSQDIDYTLLEQAKIFHLGYPPLLPELYAEGGDDLVRIFAHAVEKGITTSLDMSLPDIHSASGQVNWRNILTKTLPFVDIFVPSIEEVLFALHPETIESFRHWFDFIDRRYLEQLADEIFALGVSSIVGFKLGDYGVYLQNRTQSHRVAQIASRLGNTHILKPHQTYHQAFDVMVAGTTGAGDSSYGALLVALCKNHALDTCAEWMCAVGGCNVEMPDATSGVQTWDDTAQRLSRGWNTNRKRLSGF